ncbi:MAG: biliverdin-producing heme oxygenase [Halomonas sp.]|uniref:Biliverdin-producing heme oxygenase n=1 Tax=Halomonas casei TaxID=2742613 RepID=A0ABR9EYI0_9GAMM|nr:MULTISPECIES: biliverdin-producing heme oxygenase [Halomonas]MBE0398736.1 biliverdin-producing heme oxygenase [Halomonas casei]MDN6322935.1 biliverdin-producing heme oxygenase [Halomonas sp.]HCR97155.1 biliverdin-producing heme oxygenase [Halomonas sp.]
METLLSPSRETNTLPLSKRLKLDTHTAHEHVDKAIMELAPFASLEGYKRFLTVQYQFQRHTEVLYLQPELNDWLEGLAERSRYQAVIRDCQDLALNLDDLTDDALSVPAIESQAAAVGWLYVNEGSNLGAAFLLKYASQLNLSINFGARHLAPSDAGRGLHWRRFTAQLDAIPLSEEQANEALNGARAAFTFVKSLASNVLTNNQK